MCEWMDSSSTVAVCSATLLQSLVESRAHCVHCCAHIAWLHHFISVARAQQHHTLLLHMLNEQPIHNKLVHKLQEILNVEFIVKCCYL